jgi:RNA 2',3'-cyclic 3'-phosphodiesterase
MPRPNWFFAFPVDGSFVSDLPDVPPMIRRFHPEDVHLTLAFLGGCGEQAAERALAVLEQELARAPWQPLSVSLGEVVPMGAARRYTALSALLIEGKAEAVRCLTELGGLLHETALGRRPSRAAKPHITLARPRPRASDEARAAGLVWARALELGAVRQTLDRVALYTWAEVRRERLFRIVAERRLGPRG